MGKRKPVSGGSAAASLLGFIERIEALEEAKRHIAKDIADVYGEAASRGFDRKAMRAMVKERAMDAAARAEWQNLCQIYRSALGMLDGTPLGDEARRRFMARPAAPDAGGDDPSLESGEAASETPDLLDPPPPEAPEDLVAARAQGAAAAKAGRKVTENPFAAGSASRASWDEG